MLCYLVAVISSLYLDHHVSEGGPNQLTEYPPIPGMMLMAAGPCRASIVSFQAALSDRAVQSQRSESVSGDAAL